MANQLTNKSASQQAAQIFGKKLDDLAERKGIRVDKEDSEYVNIWKTLGFAAMGMTMIDEARKGFEYSVIPRLLKNSYFADHKEMLNVLEIPDSTLRRRKKEGRLTVDESDHVYRFCSLVNAAEELLGTNEGALEWIRSSVTGLGDRQPIEMLGTQAEFDLVMDVIGRLEHGVFT